MVMISDFYVHRLSRDLKVPGSSPGVGFIFPLICSSRPERVSVQSLHIYQGETKAPNLQTTKQAKTSIPTALIAVDDPDNMKE